MVTASCTFDGFDLAYHGVNLSPGLMAYLQPRCGVFGEQPVAERQGQEDEAEDEQRQADGLVHALGGRVGRAAPGVRAEALPGRCERMTAEPQGQTAEGDN